MALELLGADAPAGVPENFLQSQRRMLHVLLHPGHAAEAAWVDAVTDPKATDRSARNLQVVQVLARIGRFEEAFAHLDRVFAPPFEWILWGPGPIRAQPGALTVTLFSPASRWLRRSPGFARFCAKLGLSDYWAERGAAPDYFAEVAPDYDAAAEAALIHERIDVH